MNTRQLACCLLSPLLSACTALQPMPPTAADEDLRMALLQPPVRKGQAGGVFISDSPWSMTSDSRAFRPGDVLTVVLRETTQASKRANTSYGKDSSFSLSPLSLGNRTLRTDASASAEREFDGSATSSQQNTLQGAITVVVHEVLPNGLLRVEGEKTLYLNQGEEFIRLSGYVRASDIDSDNSVSSQRVANARIAYSGRGALADANSAGWLTRLFNSPWMPF
ncbi:flagellar basal body L-ring protein FlgH [Azoarcus indigens]|uniref:Flagellar L-ring protein n=1 Tax=Azoarcus indigens TaxID=29545 RepID=A0A4R6EFL0_9RHOO|nr:flagellar basal body L-ring protein FlgH [Azoarcus indigens]NMG63524.1 flagellar basal body L-ring protein FlgH [Azoarcus indigens]TDN57075.1 flagellar L-ring protein precursor FlgH [Azoarcus indigens]